MRKNSSITKLKVLVDVKVLVDASDVDRVYEVQKEDSDDDNHNLHKMRTFRLSRRKHKKGMAVGLIWFLFDLLIFLCRRRRWEMINHYPNGYGVSTCPASGIQMEAFVNPPPHL
nr:hypothetical protein [Tanacetum cinerariifolium]